MRRIHNRGQEELQAIHRQQRATTEQLVAVLSQIVQEAEDGADDAKLGSAVRDLLQEAGGLEQLQAQCEQVAAHSNNDYYPLLYRILYNVHDWTRWSRHWGPRIGFESKLSDALLAYILATFGYDCNLGPWQTARHTRQLISADMLAYVNRQHVTVERLDAVVGELINLFDRFRLPRFWGTGRSAAADGTHVELYTNNLLAEYSRRHGAYGGIAYHYVADSYIALFGQFITCGVWKGVYILDLLHRNTSNVQPDTLHADTHGQSTPIFALAYLLGIDLMPRIRRWQDQLPAEAPGPHRRDITTKP